MSKIIIILSLALLAFTSGDLPVPFEKDLYDDHLPRDITTRNDETRYRLPQNVIPLEYDIYIDLFFDERTDRPFSYDGREDIIIQASELGVTEIVLHANVDSINDVNLITANGLPFPVNEDEPYTIDPQYHFLKINLNQALTVEVNYTLTIEYSGTMNEGPMMRGIWRGWYNDVNGDERIYATTHFQPYNARQAFPCWDEPLFKAVFNMHLSRPASYVGRFSNTVLESVSVLDNGRVRDHFLPTPRMSSYLVTFLVSEAFQVTAEDTSFTPPIRIIGRSSSVGITGAYDHVLDFAVKMTEFFDEYLEIPYSTLHPNLLNDHVASPDWASAGTENWGMVSYRENNMIIGRETLMSVTHYAATLISHELAHKWFGNLVTCYWWSNTWINEGFASYFGYIGTYEKFPQYEHHDHFNSRYLQTSLSYDSGASSEALNHEVNTPAQVTGHFGTISYSKGAAFLRMVSDMITPETFRKACQYFLIDNAYEPTDQYDLYNAFARAIEEDNTLDEYLHFNFTDYYRIWVNEPGYPVLNVDIDYSTGEMSLSQERFFLSATAAPTGQIYPIPITYSTSSNNNFNNLKPTYMFTNDRAVLIKPEGEEWVIFNNLQRGHYRVNYDERNWDLITEALLNEPDTIHYLNRAQIVDDVFAFMRSGRMTYSHGFSILRFLRHETNYHVWDPAISGYTWLRNRLRHLPEDQAEFDAFILSYLEHVIDFVGFEEGTNESPTTTMTRQTILHFACMLGHTGCVQQSRSRFLAFMNNDEWVHPGIRRNVLTSGVREGGEADFLFIQDLFRDSQYANDQLEMLRALGATKDSSRLTRYLALTLTRDVRSHDKVTSFNYALLGNQENAEVVLDFVRNRINDIRLAYVEDSPARPVNSALSSLASYLNEDHLDEYEEWLHTTQADSAQFSSTLNSINTARSNIAWGTANADIILQAARDSATQVLTSLAMLLIMAAIAMAA